MIRGSLPALVTPFKNGELDLVTLKKLVDWHIAEGSHGLVPVGTTGESPTLSHAEGESTPSTAITAAANSTGRATMRKRGGDEPWAAANRSAATHTTAGPASAASA